MFKNCLIFVVLLKLACGFKPPIVDGNNSDPHAYPFMCTLESVHPTEEGFYNFCGSTILNEKFLLTAAHCVQATNDMSQFRVKCGKWDLHVAEQTEQIRNVSSIVWHELFEATSEIGFDIALIELETPLLWTKEVSPVRLATINDTLNSNSSTIIGWGAIQVEPLLHPSRLQEARIEITPFDACVVIFDEVLGVAFNVTLHEDVICAGTFGTEIDACLNDSGSPLLQKDGFGEWVQVGVASWTLFDCGPPAGYIKLSSFYDWIMARI